VYIELEATPHIWRIGDDFEVTSHTGALAQVNKTLVDNDGKVYLQTPLGLGLVHTLDVPRAAQALEMSHWTLEDVVAIELPDQYGYVMSPQMKAIARKRA
jgi:hypothetical protein